MNWIAFYFTCSLLVLRPLALWAQTVPVPSAGEELSELSQKDLTIMLQALQRGQESETANVQFMYAKQPSILLENMLEHTAEKFQYLQEEQKTLAQYYSNMHAELNKLESHPTFTTVAKAYARKSIEMRFEVKNTLLHLHTQMDITKNFLQHSNKVHQAIHTSDVDGYKLEEKILKLEEEFANKVDLYALKANLRVTGPDAQRLLEGIAKVVQVWKTHFTPSQVPTATPNVAMSTRTSSPTPSPTIASTDTSTSAIATTCSIPKPSLSAYTCSSPSPKGIIIGLTNGGNFCYMNALLKVLAQFPLMDMAFQQNLTSAASENAEQLAARENLQVKLRGLLSYLRTTQQTLPLTDKARDYIFTALRGAGWPLGQRDIYGQQDPAELLQFLTDRLQHSHNDFTQEFRAIDALTAAIVTEEKQNIAGILRLSMNGEKSLQEMIRNFFKEENISDYLDESKIKARMTYQGRVLEDLSNDKLQAQIDSIMEKKPTQIIILRSNGGGGRIQYKLYHPEQKQFLNVPMAEMPKYFRNTEVILVDRVHEYVGLEGKTELLSYVDFLKKKSSGMELKEKTITLKRKTRFTGTPPQFLTFELKRYRKEFNYAAAEEKHVRINSPVDFEEKVSVPFNGILVQYKLVGIIHHDDYKSGRPDLGHYRSELWHEVPGKWGLHDDAKDVQLLPGKWIERGRQGYIAIYKLL